MITKINQSIDNLSYYTHPKLLFKNKNVLNKNKQIQFQLIYIVLINLINYELHRYVKCNVLINISLTLYNKMLNIKITSKYIFKLYF